MKDVLGEEGTEQFTVETYVDDRSVRVQRIHDPFVHSRATVSISRWDHFVAIFRRREIKVEIAVRASEGAQQAIMMLSPTELQKATDRILEERRTYRESHPSTMEFSVAK